MLPTPFFIEDVLTISKEELERRTRKKTFDNEENDSSNRYGIHYYTILSSCSKDKNDFDLTFRMTFESETKLNGNVVFHIESTNYSVKYNVYEYDVVDYTLETKVVEWKKTTFLKLNDILNPEKNYIVDEKLTIKVKGVFFWEEVAANPRTTLAQLLWERDDRDFIISVGKKDEPKTDIKVHKFVLAARSEVFDRMLQYDMKEKSENKLEINDFDAEIVQATIKFFYDQDEFDSADLDTHIELLRFADKYDIQDLKDTLQCKVMPHTNPSTICKIANAAVIFNCFPLKKFCFDCVNLFSQQGASIKNIGDLDEYFKEAMGENIIIDDPMDSESSADESDEE